MMRRALFISCCLLLGFTGFGQSKTANFKRRAFEEDQRYQADRFRMSTPPFELEKVRGLIKKYTKKDDFGWQEIKIPQSTFDSLSFAGKFTYCMINPEAYSQVCAILPPDSNVRTKIYAHLPFRTEGATISDRQYKFLQSDREAMIGLLKRSIRDSSFIGMNYKNLIISLEAYELIPILVSNYKKWKDRDLLTVLIKLMQQQKFTPYINSGLEKQLQENTTRYFHAHIPFTTENETLIIRWATELYHAKTV